MSAQRRAELDALLVAARPELHRYASRMLGSRFDGEDVVQDVAERALKHVERLEPDATLRPWLFRIAHNRVLDLLRSRRTRAAPEREEEEARPETPEQALVRVEAVDLALQSFLRLPVTQRSVLILKDVLGLSLQDIAATLDLSLAAVKAALHRARGAIRPAEDGVEPDAVPPSAEVRLYAELFNNRDWEGLTALLAQDVRAVQHARATLRGPQQIRDTFFAIYSRTYDCRLAPARAEGREALAALDPETGALLYVMRIDWREGQAVEIHDYRHARYLLDGLGVTWEA